MSEVKLGSIPLYSGRPDTLGYVLEVFHDRVPDPFHDRVPDPGPSKGYLIRLQARHESNRQSTFLPMHLTPAAARALAALLTLPIQSP